MDIEDDELNSLLEAADSTRRQHVALSPANASKTANTAQPPAAETAAEPADEGLVGHRSNINRAPPRSPLFRR
jgi:hypothetical protein